MGKRKGKSSRKGKKEWRANISTEDVHDFFEKSTKDAHTGGSLSCIPTESLFYVDTSKDLKAVRKINKKREKVLRCDSILQKNPFVESVPSSKLKVKTVKKKKDNKASHSATTSLPVDISKDGMMDLWDNQVVVDETSTKQHKPSNVPAVEIEPPGCSFNPEHEAHQDSLAKAVAEEMHKQYRDELGPQPVQLVTSVKEIDEEEMLFLDVDEELDDTKSDSDTYNESSLPERRTLKTKRVTRVELNKRAKRKEELKRETEAKQKKQLAQEIDGITMIMQEIAKEDEEKQKKRMRRMVVKQEMLKTRPPRLGKHKFVAAPTQVLLSEEISGSLRKLKGCCTLVRDRYKSLEKRGLITPSSKNRK